MNMDTNLQKLARWYKIGQITEDKYFMALIRAGKPLPFKKPENLTMRDWLASMGFFVDRCVRDGSSVVWYTVSLRQEKNKSHNCGHLHVSGPGAVDCAVKLARSKFEKDVRTRLGLLDGHNTTTTS